MPVRSHRILGRAQRLQPRRKELDQADDRRAAQRPVSPQAHAGIRADPPSGVPRAVRTTCRRGRVQARAGPCAWQRRAPSDPALTDAWLIERSKAIHAENRGVYGSPRIHAMLTDPRTRPDYRGGASRRRPVELPASTARPTPETAQAPVLRISPVDRRPRGCEPKPSLWSPKLAGSTVHE